MIIGPPPKTIDVEKLHSWCNELYTQLLYVSDALDVPVYEASSTSVSTSGTGEDDLSSSSISKQLYDSSNGIKITGAGTKTNSNGNKTLKFYFGSTSVTFNAAANDTNDWRFEGMILFESSDAQRITWNGSGLTHQYDTSSEDITSGDITIKVTGECAHASDVITQTMWVVETF